VLLDILVNTYKEDWNKHPPKGCLNERSTRECRLKQFGHVKII